jgi:hypothetical protein
MVGDALLPFHDITVFDRVRGERLRQKEKPDWRVKWPQVLRARRSMNYERLSEAIPVDLLNKLESDGGNRSEQTVDSRM